MLRREGSLAPLAGAASRAARFPSASCGRPARPLPVRAPPSPSITQSPPMSAWPCRPRRRAARPLALEFQRRPPGVGKLGGDRHGLAVALALGISGISGIPGRRARAAPHAERAHAPARQPPILPRKYTIQVETALGDRPQVPFPTRLLSRSRSSLSLSYVPP